LTQRNSAFGFLYANKFVRGEYLGLIFRLMLVGLILVYAFKDNSWVWSSVATTLLMYLIGFQILPLYEETNQKLTSKVLPVSEKQKIHDLRRLMIILFIIFGILMMVELLLNYKPIDSIQIVGIYVVAAGILAFLYLPSRIKK
jgi:ABC-2 type transport system permease protein